MKKIRIVSFMLTLVLLMGLVSCDKVVNFVETSDALENATDDFASESLNNNYTDKVNGDNSGKEENSDNKDHETMNPNSGNDTDGSSDKDNSANDSSSSKPDNTVNNNTNDNTDGNTDGDTDGNTGGDTGGNTNGDSDGGTEVKPSEFVASAVIVNKNGAKGVLTLISDDGDQRTSDFFYTVVAPKYDSFKITVAVPTHKVANIYTTSNGQDYVFNSNGGYSITYCSNTYKSSISGSPFKTAGTYANMKDFWMKITDTGAIELASHSHTHGPWPDTDNLVKESNGNVIWPKGSVIKEIRASAQILRNGLKQETPFIMRPGGNFMTTEVSTYFKKLVASDSTYLGMRGSNGAPPFVKDGDISASKAKLNSIDKFKTENGRLTIATVLVRGYEAGFDSTGNAFATTDKSSRAEIKAAGISAWEQYVDYSIQYGQWASIGFHSVVSDSTTKLNGYEVYDWQVIALMDYVQPLVESGDLWLASFSDAAKYYFEWSSAEVSVQAHGEEYIEVKLTDKETDERFDEALTVKVSVPNSWKTAKLSTNGATSSLDIHVAEDGSHFVYANIVPSDSVSTIRP